MRSLNILLLFIFIFGCSKNDIPPPHKEIIITIERNYDEVFQFEILPAMGPDTIQMESATAELLSNIPYLFSSGMVPPAFVVNEILSKGKIDAGMSGGAIWKPYKLKKDNFVPLLKELQNISSLSPLIYREPDGWVKNYEDWNVWVMYIRSGIPWQEHKRLNDAVVSLENQMEVAKQNRDEGKINELHLKSIAAGTELSEFIMRNRK
jgi:hypothetical protein